MGHKRNSAKPCADSLKRALDICLPGRMPADHAWLPLPGLGRLWEYETKQPIGRRLVADLVRDNAGEEHGLADEVTGFLTPYAAAVVVGQMYNGFALKLRPAGAAINRNGFHWAFRQRRRQRAASFKRMLGSITLGPMMA